VVGVDVEGEREGEEIPRKGREGALGKCLWRGKDAKVGGGSLLVAMGKKRSAEDADKSRMGRGFFYDINRVRLTLRARD
jgi:hypothetical protein